MNGEFVSRVSQGFMDDLSVVISLLWCLFLVVEFFLAPSRQPELSYPHHFTEMFTRSRLYFHRQPTRSASKGRQQEPRLKRQPAPPAEFVKSLVCALPASLRDVEYLGWLMPSLASACIYLLLRLASSSLSFSCLFFLHRPVRVGRRSREKTLSL